MRILLVVLSVPIFMMGCDQPAPAESDAAVRKNLADPDTHGKTCAGACSALPHDCCAEREDCITVVAKYVADNCIGEDISHCRDSGTMCGQQITYAMAPSERCWRFSNTCTPDMWNVGSCDSSAFDDLPECEAE